MDLAMLFLDLRFTDLAIERATFAETTSIDHDAGESRQTNHFQSVYYDSQGSLCQFPGKSTPGSPRNRVMLGKCEAGVLNLQNKTIPVVCHMER